MKGSQEEESLIPHPPTKVFLVESLALSGRGLIHGVKAPVAFPTSTLDTLPTAVQTLSPQQC